jgi:hypothetical protein
MFTRLSIHHGLARWVSGLGCFLRRRRPSPPAADMASRRDPKTEAERSLWQAMGWVEDGWGDMP